MYAKRQSRMLNLRLPLGTQFESCTVVMRGGRFMYTASGYWRSLEDGREFVWGEARIVDNDPGRLRMRYSAFPLQHLR